MPATRPADLRHPALWTYYACLIAVGLMVGILGPTLNGLALQTSSDLQGISIILAMRPLGYLLCTLTCGPWLDRRPAHPLLGIAALVSATALALMPLTPILAILALLVLIMGFAQGLLDVGSNTLIVWLYHEKVGPYLNGLHFFFGLGAILGPLVVAQSLLRTGSYRSTFWVLAVALLPLALLLFRVPSPAPEAHDEEAAPASDRTLVGLFVAFAFLYGGAEAGMGAWIYNYAVAQGLADMTHAAYLSSVFWGCLGLGRLLGIPVTLALHPTRFIGLLLPLALISLAAFQVWPTSSVTVWAATAATGLSFSCLFPSLINYAGRRLSGKARVSAKLTSTFFVGLALGAMSLPWLMGQIFQPWGPRAALGLVLGAIALLAGVFVLIVQRPEA